eukprot:Nk52_evm6s208 gene=Nk52_evmTU6s208
MEFMRRLTNRGGEQTRRENERRGEGEINEELAIESTTEADLEAGGRESSQDKNEYVVLNEEAVGVGGEIKLGEDNEAGNEDSAAQHRDVKRDKMKDEGGFMKIFGFGNNKEDKYSSFHPAIDVVARVGGGTVHRRHFPGLNKGKSKKKGEGGGNDNDNKWGQEDGYFYHTKHFLPNERDEDISAKDYYRFYQVNNITSSKSANTKGDFHYIYGKKGEDAMKSQPTPVLGELPKQQRKPQGRNFVWPQYTTNDKDGSRKSAGWSEGSGEEDDQMLMAPVSFIYDVRFHSLIDEKNTGGDGEDGSDEEMIGLEGDETNDGTKDSLLMEVSNSTTVQSVKAFISRKTFNPSSQIKICFEGMIMEVSEVMINIKPSRLMKFDVPFKIVLTLREGSVLKDPHKLKKKSLEASSPHTDEEKPPAYDEIRF